MRRFLACLFAAAPALSLFAQAETDDYQPLLDEWRRPGEVHDIQLQDRLVSAAMRAEHPEVIEEVSAGGDVAGLEIKLPQHAKRVEMKTMYNLGVMPGVPYLDSSMDCVIRRMTKTRFEAWTPERGWLFDDRGKLVNKAAVPRRDGRGREWYGAFLPDGRWVTTDLWEFDQTLTFFSKNGKWLKEIKGADLAPSSDEMELGDNLIGWARCDRDGTGWVVSVGCEGGRAAVFVKPHGKAHGLPGVILNEIGEDTGEFCYAPWKLCYPRELEPKGFYIELHRPSDDCKSLINFGEAGHGMGVGFASYAWGGMKQRKVIPGGDHNFGFLPGSHDVFLGAADAIDPKTWFFSSNGKCRGWIKAAYLTDAADGTSTCYCDGDNCVVTLDRDLKPRSATQFTLAGLAVKPVKLFADLKLGFFLSGERLVLARW